MTGFNSKKAAAQAKLAQPAQEPIGRLNLGAMINTSEGLEYDDWDVELSRKTIDALQERLVTCDPVTLDIYTTPPAAQPEQEFDVLAPHPKPTQAQLAYLPPSPDFYAPPQRPWVGLTDEEIALIDWESLVTKKDCVRAIETLLKQRNT
jgi:hypothetical protein